MPPKAVPVEEPPVEDEQEGPHLSPEEALAKSFGMKPKGDPVFEELLERSASIQHDPKMKEMRNMLNEHSHCPVAAVAGDGSRAGQAVKSLRTGGCGRINMRVKALEHTPVASLVVNRPRLERYKATLGSQSLPVSPTGAGDNSNARCRRIPIEEEDALKEAAKKRMERFSMASSQSQYTDFTNKTLKRLMIDMNLARDPDRQKHYAHRTRCDHLDKMHVWYNHYSLKEERKKNAAAPPYLLFSNEGPVAPGSMRVQLRQTSPLLRSFGSSPALLSLSQSPPPDGVETASPQ